VATPLSAQTRQPNAEESPSFNWDRIIIWGGFGLSILAALAFWLLMEAIQHAARPDDPDAQSLVIAPDHPRHLIDFSLLNQAGQTVTRKDLVRKIVVVNFLFTSCSVTCPFVNAQMDEISRATAARPDVRLLSITLDPVDDTVPVLSHYSEGYRADPKRWSFLTGSQTTVHDLVGTSFLPPDTTGQFSYMPGNFAHVQRIVLVDRTGRVVSYFDGLNQNAGDAVISQIEKMEQTP
jgi:protein SCO1/2